MSPVDGWDLTVPEEAAELAAELRRHGVLPGQRLHIVHAREPAKDQSADASAPPRRFKFAGTLKDAEPDLARNMDRYLERGFGRE